MIMVMQIIGMKETMVMEVLIAKAEVVPMSLYIYLLHYIFDYWTNSFVVSCHLKITIARGIVRMSVIVKMSVIVLLTCLREMKTNNIGMLIMNLDP